MTTIFTNDDAELPIAATRTSGVLPGEAYCVSTPLGHHDLDFRDGGVSDDVLLAVLLDRAELADMREPSNPKRKRVAMLKALKSGNDGRGRDVVKRGPYKKKSE